MKYIRYAAFAIPLVLLSGATARVRACLCYERQPPCVEYWQADAVFTGLVTEVSPDFKDHQASSRSGTRTVVFSVQQAFRGVTGTEFKLQSLITDCEAQFSKGQSYFVYAYYDKRNDTFGTSACSRTQLLSSAGEDLAFVEKLSRGVRDLSISGIVLEDRYHPVANLAIDVRGSAGHYKVTTDKDGRFELAVPEPGDYKVRMVLRGPYVIVGAQHQLERITRVSEEPDHLTLEYGVSVEPGKCVFLDVPVVLYKPKG